ncbi:tyrosine-type recombinase/integrase [Halorubrum sp. CBA1125]|nr:tyrosine-type recombinase/integrase [Halorubrum sp. CBA1125]
MIGCVMTEPNDDQGTMVRWEDHIAPILEHPDIHIRNKALVAVAWESHARPSELHRLTFGDVEDRGDHVAILITRRDGQKRLLTLDESMPYFKQWVQAEHPVTEWLAPDADPLEDASSEMPIWTQIDSNKRIPYMMLYDITNRACERSDVPTKFTLHDIRRSRAKLLIAQSGLRAHRLRELFGWGPQVPKELIETAEDGDLDEDSRPQLCIRCPNCGVWTLRNRPCIWCGLSR